MKHFASAALTFLLLVPMAARASSGVFISEVAWAGSSLSSADEWFELFNPGETPLDLSGWRIEGAGTAGAALTVPSGSKIPAHGTFLIANYSADDAKSALSAAPDWVTTGVALPNTNLRLVLKDAWGTVVDEAGSGSSTPPAGSSGETKTAMTRLWPLSPGGGSEAWSAASTSTGFDSGVKDLGTPGMFVWVEPASGSPVAAAAEDPIAAVDETVDVQTTESRQIIQIQLPPSAVPPSVPPASNPPATPTINVWLTLNNTAAAAPEEGSVPRPVKAEKSAAVATTKKPKYKGAEFTAEVAVAPGVYGKARLIVMTDDGPEELRLTKSPAGALLPGSLIRFTAQTKQEGGRSFLLANTNSLEVVESGGEPEFADTDRWPDGGGRYFLKGTVSAVESRKLTIRLDDREGEIVLPAGTAASALKPGDEVGVRAVVSASSTAPAYLADPQSLVLVKSFSAERRPAPKPAKLPVSAAALLTVVAVGAGILAYLRHQRMTRLALTRRVPQEEDLE
jgi:hypothetical protein